MSVAREQVQRQVLPSLALAISIKLWAAKLCPEFATPGRSEGNTNPPDIAEQDLPDDVRRMLERFVDALDEGEKQVLCEVFGKFSQGCSNWDLNKMAFADSDSNSDGVCESSNTALDKLADRVLRRWRSIVVRTWARCICTNTDLRQAKGEAHAIEFANASGFSLEVDKTWQKLRQEKGSREELQAALSFGLACWEDKTNEVGRGLVVY